jgi:hypothetical protein
MLSSMQGSFIPLARSSADRKRANDPRSAIDERYRDKDAYVAQVGKAAQDLVGQGYLLADDVPTITRDAGRHWDYLASAPTTSTPPQR